MVLNSRFILIFSLILTLSVNGETTPFKTIQLDDQLAINQEEVTSANLFEGALAILENLALNSLDFPTYSDDLSQVYYGKVGLAGIGLNLLQARIDDSSWVGLDVNTRLINLATSIGDHLINIESVDNSTHALWTVNNQTTEIDISLEFGLLGLAEFFVELYNQTENAVYAVYAEKTLKSVYDLANVNSTDISFSFNITLPYYNSWYPTNNFNYYSEDFYATMTGLSYGASGIASVAMKYLRDVDTSNDVLGNELLDKSVHWLWRQRIENGSELSFKTGVEMIGMETTGIAVGAPGIGELYLDLYEITGNDSYLNNAIAIKDWLNGTTSLTRRTDSTWYINDTVIFDRELGTHMGIAGNLIFLDHLNDYKLNDNLTDMIVSAGLNMRIYGQETDNKLEFGERVIGIIREYGSTSMSFGGGGIFKIINDLGTKYDIDALLEFGSKAKNYVTSMYIEKDGNYAIYDKSSFSLETNPMRGLSGSLLFLSSFTEGIFELSSNTLNFGSLEIGNSLEKSITLKNAGEGGLEVSWASLSGPFDTTGQSITLDGLEEYFINVTYTPTTESIVDDELGIMVGNDLYTIGLNGIGFDTPTYTFEAPDNGSLLTEDKSYSFVITATDSSGMDDVTMTIRNENETVISSTQLPIVDGTYKGSWDTKGYSNGTYIIDFGLVDTLGHSSSLRLVYNIGFYTSRVEEVIFSEQTLYGIIGGIAVFLVVAVVITMRIKSKA